MQLKQQGSIFGTRPMAHRVFDDVQTNTPLMLDFSGVQMASSSFLHETMLIFKKKSIEINMQNMSDVIKLQYAKAIREI